MGTHPIFESDFDCLTGSDRLEKDATATVRTSRTQSLGSAVVSQIQRSVFMIWDPRKHPFFPSQNMSSWSLMNWNSSHQKLWKPPVPVLKVHDQKHRKRIFPSSYEMPSIPRYPYQQDVVMPVLIDCKPVCVVPMVNHKVSSPVSVLVNH